MHTKNATHARIESIACVVFHVHALRISVCLIVLQAVLPLRCMCCVRQLGKRVYAYENGLKGQFPSCRTDATHAGYAK